MSSGTRNAGARSRVSVTARRSSAAMRGCHARLVERVRDVDALHLGIARQPRQVQLRIDGHRGHDARQHREHREQEPRASRVAKRGSQSDDAAKPLRPVRGVIGDDEAAHADAGEKDREGRAFGSYQAHEPAQVVAEVGPAVDVDPLPSGPSVPAEFQAAHGEPSRRQSGRRRRVRHAVHLVADAVDEHDPRARRRCRVVRPHSQLEPVRRAHGRHDASASQVRLGWTPSPCRVLYHTVGPGPPRNWPGGAGAVPVN